jgi:putative transposase
MRTRRQAHAVYRAQYHAVIMPRYRYKVLTEGVKKYLEIKLKEIGKHYPEIEYIEYNIQPDHVHLVLSFPPKYSGSKVIGIIKRNTGKALRNKFDFIRERYYGLGGMWSVGYFISTVGLDEETIKNYVKYQQKEDSGQAELAI